MHVWGLHFCTYKPFWWHVIRIRVSSYEHHIKQQVILYYGRSGCLVPFQLKWFRKSPFYLCLLTVNTGAELYILQKKLLRITLTIEQISQAPVFKGLWKNFSKIRFKKSLRTPTILPPEVFTRITMIIISGFRPRIFPLSFLPFRLLLLKEI